MIETASGRAANEMEDRTWTQLAVEGVYRFVDDQFYVGGRYNTVSGDLPGSGAEASITRVAASAGWFPTRNLLLKAEYVSQTYDDFAQTSIFNGGEFNGFMIEGVIAF